VQGASASHMIEVGTRKGRDEVTSKGFTDIYTDNAQRDQIRAHQAYGKKVPGVFDEITCTNKRPSRLEIDKGLDEVEDC
jgi:hypothetical protein